jgi:hypothetical protein
MVTFDQKNQDDGKAYLMAVFPSGSPTGRWARLRVAWHLAKWFWQVSGVAVRPTTPPPALSVKVGEPLTDKQKCSERGCSSFSTLRFVYKDMIDLCVCAEHAKQVARDPTISALGIQPKPITPPS